MAERKHIKDIVSGIVSSIDKTLTVNEIDPATAEARSTKLYICDLKWANVNDFVLDDQEREAQIREVGENYIVVYKTDPFIWDSNIATLQTAFYYQSGTPLDVNAEWLQINLTSESKLPLFWLYLPVVETNFKNGQGLDRESEIRLYIIEQTNMTDFLVNDHFTNVVKYLWAYYEAFFEALKKDKSFANIESVETRELYRFGSETEQGFESNIIDANLSALECRFTLPIRKNSKCLC